ncbi:MAG: cyclic nucleotide-binding domain-containing protein, partial [Anaerolineales bacterium]
MKTNYNQHSMELEGFGIDSQFGNHKYDAKKVSHLFSTAKQIQYEPQQSIFQEGHSADTIFFIRKGMVKLISYLPNGNARIVRLLGPGKILGLEGMVGNTY